jgi:hypothetical protein
MTREEILERVEQILVYVTELDEENDPSWPMKMESARDEVLELIDASHGNGSRVLKSVHTDSNFSRDKESWIAR